MGPMFSQSVVNVFQKYTSPSVVLIQPCPGDPIPTVEVLTTPVLPINTRLIPCGPVAPVVP